MTTSVQFQPDNAAIPVAKRPKAGGNEDSSSFSDVFADTAKPEAAPPPALRKDLDVKPAIARPRNPDRLAPVNSRDDSPIVNESKGSVTAPAKAGSTARTSDTSTDSDPQTEDEQDPAKDRATDGSGAEALAGLVVLQGAPAAQASVATLSTDQTAASGIDAIADANPAMAGATDAATPTPDFSALLDKVATGDIQFPAGTAGTATKADTATAAVVEALSEGIQSAQAKPESASGAERAVAPTDAPTAAAPGQAAAPSLPGRPNTQFEVPFSVAIRASVPQDGKVSAEPATGDKSAKASSEDPIAAAATLDGTPKDATKLTTGMPSEGIATAASTENPADPDAGAASAEQDGIVEAAHPGAATRKTAATPALSLTTAADAPVETDPTSDFPAAAVAKHGTLKPEPAKGVSGASTEVEVDGDKSVDSAAKTAASAAAPATPGDAKPEARADATPAAQAGDTTRNDAVRLDNVRAPEALPTQRDPAAVTQATAPASNPLANATSNTIPHLAIAVASKARSGERQFDIRLDPAELGRIDVKLLIDDKGTATTRISVERSETLDLLQRDARSLERALTQAGFKADEGSLQFNLKDPREDSRQPQGQFAEDGGRNRRTYPGLDERLVEAAVPSTAVGISLYGRGLSRAGGVDVRV